MSRYAPAALESAVGLVRVIASDRAAILFAALVDARGARTAALTTVSLSALTALAAHHAPSDDPEARLHWVDAADHDFAALFGFHMVDVARLGHDVVAPDAAIAIPETFSTLLESPLSAADASRVPIIDTTSEMWVQGVVALADAESGHHLALRLSPAGPDCADLAGHLAAVAETDVRISADGRWLSATLLRAELHAGENRPVIVVADEVLVHRVSASPGYDAAEGEERRGERFSLAIEAMARPLLGHFSRLRGVYVWHVPMGPLPRELDGIVAGCIGPLTFDARASIALLALRAPDLGSTARAALCAMVTDPRKVEPAVAATAALAVGNAIIPDEAALFLARSHGVVIARGRKSDVTFDPALVIADVAPEDLLARAEHLARGGRIVFWGPPAGGKSSLAYALCAQMLAKGASTGDVAREIVVIAAADILMTKWGATERLVRAMFTQAQDLGNAPLLIDEFDAFAGVREHGGATSNNGLLVRSLTDEFLRELDAFESVPVVATCNDLLSIDAAARRRFHLVVAVGDELTPEREARAWRVLLGRDPPPDWLPLGAAVGDIATAGKRCRMLGRETSQDLAEAIADARSARLGLGSAPQATRSLH